MLKFNAIHQGCMKYAQSLSMPQSAKELLEKKFNGHHEFDAYDFNGFFPWWFKSLVMDSNKLFNAGLIPTRPRKMLIQYSWDETDIAIVTADNRESKGKRGTSMIEVKFGPIRDVLPEDENLIGVRRQMVENGEADQLRKMFANFDRDDPILMVQEFILKDVEDQFGQAIPPLTSIVATPMSSLAGRWAANVVPTIWCAPQIAEEMSKNYDDVIKSEASNLGLVMAMVSILSVTDGVEFKLTRASDPLNYARRSRGVPAIPRYSTPFLEATGCPLDQGHIVGYQYIESVVKDGVLVSRPRFEPKIVQSA